VKGIKDSVSRTARTKKKCGKKKPEENSQSMDISQCRGTRRKQELSMTCAILYIFWQVKMIMIHMQFINY
jgi:hypothetical protein